MSAGADLLKDALSRLCLPLQDSKQRPSLQTDSVFARSLHPATYALLPPSLHEKPSIVSMQSAVSKAAANAGEGSQLADISLHY